MASIALGINFHNDVAAMRGLLELGSRYFDNIFSIDASPDGDWSNDGSVELMKDFGITPAFADLNEGFGFVRTRLLHECGCEWCMVLDCDERFWPQLPVMTCEGTESYPAQASPRLTVTVKADIIDQGAHIKNLINNPALMAVRMTRRHWFGFDMRRPSQNWYGPDGNKDHQLRCVRNHESIGYVRERKMHERLLDTRTGKDPVFAYQDEHGGGFIDHYHLHFRKEQPGHKEANEERYAKLSRGEKMI